MRRAYFFLFAALAALVLLAPLNKSDLPGYDDALYSHIAKTIAQTGNWLDPRNDGYPVLEHPPLFMWMQAALFALFGVSDAMARLPAALCGLGTILLTYWLTRRLTGNSTAALVAMSVLSTSLYFMKYSSRAMTDVPFAFFCMVAICAWVKAEDHWSWLIAAGLATALALLTRELAGLVLPAVMVAHAIETHRRVNPWWAAAALLAALAPPVAWYALEYRRYGSFFTEVHFGFLQRSFAGSAPLSLAHALLGPLDYAWMLTKSYWPWLPLMIAGLVISIRDRTSRSWLLLTWVAAVWLEVSIGQGRVLRYMLPAWPAFAMLSAIALVRFVAESTLRRAIRWATPVLAAICLIVALLPRQRIHAADIRPIAQAATAAAQPGQRVGFYDGPAPRWDESSQLQWYGDLLIDGPWNQQELARALAAGSPQVLILDRDTYLEAIRNRAPLTPIASSGHLVCARLDTQRQPRPPR